ncbi:MAG: hypothetical protein K2O86_06420 [Clostridia bacterium]|nr:hypothetical protein [Clostridia bacterium]
MKKTVAIILIMLMAMTCVLVFAGCNNDDGEEGYNSAPFVGAISQTTYDSVENAVKGFLQEEITVESIRYMANYVSYAKTSDLTQEEIGELAISDKLKVGLLSAEKGQVEYVINTSTYIYERTVYVVSFNINGDNVYRFYTPVEEIGQTPSASSWASLFDWGKYFNCTVEEYNKYGEGYEWNKVGGCKITQSAVWSCIYGYGDIIEGYGYSIIEDGKFTYSANMYEGQWEVYDSNGSLSLEDEVKIFLYKYEYFMVPMYFVKTENGYKLNTAIDAEGYFNDFTIVVDNGRITQFIYTYFDGTMSRTTFSDFGTTKVDVPKVAMDAIKAYQAQN